MTHDQERGTAIIAIGVLGILVLLTGVMAYAIRVNTDQYNPKTISETAQEQLADQ